MTIYQETGTNDEGCMLETHQFDWYISEVLQILYYHSLTPAKALYTHAIM